MPKKPVTKKKAVVKKKAVRAPRPPAPKEKPFKLDFELNDEHVHIEGDTVTECLQQLQPKFYKTKGVFIFHFEGKSCRRVLMPFAIRRLLANNFDKEVFQGRILKIFK